jgi:hypothetical protein
MTSGSSKSGARSPCVFLGVDFANVQYIYNENDAWRNLDCKRELWLVWMCRNNLITKFAFHVHILDFTLAAT